MDTREYYDREGHSVEVTVPYGASPDDGKELPLDRAAAVLAMMYDEQPALLSALIGRAYTGAAPAVTRQRQPRDG